MSANPTPQHCQQCHGTGRSELGPFGEIMACPYCNGTGMAGLFTGLWVRWIKWGLGIMFALGILGLIPHFL